MMPPIASFLMNAFAILVLVTLNICIAVLMGGILADVVDWLKRRRGM